MNPQIVFTPPRQLPGGNGTQSWANWALALEELGFVALYALCPDKAFSYERKLKDGVVLQAVLVPTVAPEPEGFQHCRIAVLSRYADGDERELCAFYVMAAEGLKGVLELPKKGRRR